jgi:hypothetical protein
VLLRDLLLRRLLVGLVGLLGLVLWPLLWSVLDRGVLLLRGVLPGGLGLGRLLSGLLSGPVIR